jgi:autotransporter-associated beta strand protein
MLGTSEYGESLDFNSSPLSSAANMTLAAHEGGSTYSGTITPSTSVVANPNTYQLGGGNGTLTLPGAQLTGSRNLLVTNGGEARLEGANTYTGTGGELDGDGAGGVPGIPIAATRVVGSYLPTIQPKAEANVSSTGSEADTFEVDSTLTVTNLADGGAASSIGSSTSAAGNLFIQRATLKYDGAGATTDRLFTVGTGGATIDASGDGALVFDNPGTLGIDTAEDRYAIASTAAPGNGQNELWGNPDPTINPAFYAPFFTEDLTPGIQVHAHNPSDGSLVTSGGLEDDDSPVVITAILAPDVVTVGEVDVAADNATDPIGDPPNPWPGYALSGRYLIKFGPAPARFLTLTGENTGDNTLAPLVGDAPDIGEAVAVEVAAGYGTVGIRKTGLGKWILTGDNTYTGETQVQGGTLLVNGTQTGTGLTTVSAGATLGGTGTLGGAVVNNGTLAPGGSIESLATGSVTFGLDSIFEVELSGAMTDELFVTGDIDLTALGNTLSVIELTAPTLSSYVIATYSGTLTGEFETITEGYSVDYGSGTNSVITLNIEEVLLIGDYNEDGKVSAADFTYWRDHLGAATLPNRDPANSGAVDADDFNSWKAHYGEGTFGSGSGAGASSATAAVPEPGSLILAAIGGLIGLAVTRRRK